MAVRVAISAEKDLPSTGWQCGSYANAQEMPAPLMDGYDLYYRSGVYERRYPAPNPATLQLVLGLLDGDDTRVLDFGCGSGRYAVPLAMNRPVRVLAYDPCQEGLRLLRHRALSTTAEHRIETLTGPLDALAASVAREGPVDLVIMLFGVLGHIRFRRERLRHLETVRGLLRSGGLIVVSVPNAQRRFHREQASPWRGEGAREPGDVLYARNMGAQQVELFYHLYRFGELEVELSDAGYRPISTCSESILPEWLVSRARAAAALDRGLRAVTPTRLAYGFLTVAANGKD